MPSPLYKPQYGAIYKPQYGVQNDDGGGSGPPGPTWTVDATSGKGVPGSVFEWADVASAAGLGAGPSSLYLMQEASGNPQDTAATRHLSALGTWSYSQSVPGWATKSIKCTGGSVARLINAAGYNNINAESKLVLTYLRYATSGTAVIRTLYRFGDVFDDDATLETTTTPRLQVGNGGGAGRTAGTGANADVVRPYVLRINVAAGTVDAFTEQEKIVGGTLAGNGTELCYGGDNNQTYFAGTTDYLHSAVWTGTNAQLTDNNVRTLLQTLGWSVAW